MKNDLWNVNRRDFLKLSGAGLLALLHDRAFGDAAPPAGAMKRLILLELNGGNDGLNTVIPYADPAYYDARLKIAIQPERVHSLNGQFGLHPDLPKLQERYLQNQVAIIHGVGHPLPDLSHFAMADYWRAGHLQGMTYTEQTGWIGRSLDKLMGTNSALAGLSIGWEMGPVMYANSASTAAADGPWAGYLDMPWEVTNAYRAALSNMNRAIAGDSIAMAAARAGLANGIGLRDFLSPLQENGQARSTIYPGTQTGNLFKFAADILALPSWIQALHIALPMEFDHHVGQLAKQSANFAELDAALDAFLRDLKDIGIQDDVLVMTASEFGRRVADNDEGGTDHGTANCLFMIGTGLNAGMHGTPPSLTDLDENGNLKATTSFTDVLAAVAEQWLGVNGVIASSAPLNLFV